ncbi:MAG: protoheme IX farnesyltransferase [Alphaproteobacteria bacterium]|nr:protoheme IX farnesyltransferase [Alphaproteobacteria bacterium]
MPMKSYVELLKLRIALMIALTAVTGYGAVAETVEPLHLALLVVVMVLGSGGSAVFNHVFDRDIDALMKRTRNRPMVVGTVAPTEALMLAGGLTMAGIVLAVSALNWVVAVHLFLGVFVYAVIYTVWLKRRTWWNIVFGGAAGSFALLAGAAVVQPSQWALPALLAVTLFLWTPSHFWALSILLVEDYRAANVPMLPVVVGVERTAWCILSNSVLLVGSSLVPWTMGWLGTPYLIGAGLVGVLLLGLNVKLVLTPSRYWAGWNFAASMPYLLGLFIAVFADKHWF